MIRKIIGGRPMLENVRGYIALFDRDEIEVTKVGVARNG